MPPNDRRTIERILADPRYWDAKHPEHAAIKGEATRAFRDAYPESADDPGRSATTIPSIIHVRAHTRRQNGEITQVSEYDRTTSIARAPASRMSPSEKGLAFIKEREDFQGETYRDQAENDTIGYGHRIRAGDSFPKGITREQAERLFAVDVAAATAAVRRLVKADLSQPQFDALVSLVYNVGEGAFATSRLLRKLNAGDATGAATEFDDWNKIRDGKKELKPNPGLTNRRAFEKNLFLNGRYR